jgi:hypothetical protein
MPGLAHRKDNYGDNSPSRKAIRRVGRKVIIRAAYMT